MSDYIIYIWEVAIPLIKIGEQKYCVGGHILS